MAKNKNRDKSQKNKMLFKTLPNMFMIKLHYFLMFNPLKSITP